MTKEQLLSELQDDLVDELLHIKMFFSRPDQTFEKEMALIDWAHRAEEYLTKKYNQGETE